MLKKALATVLALAVVLAVSACGPFGESAKLSQMEADEDKIYNAVKEAFNNYYAELYYFTYNGKTVDEATVGDTLAENGISDDILAERIIDGETYRFVFTKDAYVKISGGSYDNTGLTLTPELSIKYLFKYYKGELDE